MLAARMFMIFHIFFYNFLCFLCILRIKIGYKKKKTPFSCRIIIKNICKSINILYILFINIVYSVDSIHFLSVFPQKKKIKYDIILFLYIILLSSCGKIFLAACAYTLSRILTPFAAKDCLTLRYA